MTATPCTPQRRAIDHHFAGALDPAGERALRAHLGSCPECTRYYARHQLLARLDPRALGAEERLARGLGLRPPRRPIVWAGALSLAGAVALALLVLSPRITADPDRGFAARGGATLPPVQLTAFRLVGGKAVPVDGRIAATDELAFAYENRAGRRHLLLFAQDEHGRIYWFFPSWTDPAQDPTAVAIEATDRPTELREAVRHDFGGSRLTLRAVFTDEPLSVHEAERRLAQGRTPLSDDALEQSQRLEVTR